MFDTGTIKLAKIAGIPIRLHWSFLLIFVWVGYNAWQDNLSTRGFIFMQLYVLILFVCVILHEYGQYVVGRMGVPYKDKDINVISLIVDAPQDVISALSGKLGMLPEVSTKTIYPPMPQ